MRSAVISLLVVVTGAGCEPEEKCGGELYWDGIEACRPCPNNAKFRNGSCVCEDSEYYEFVNHRCVLRDGAMPPQEEPDDAGMPERASCADYCEFQALCIGKNSLAIAALSDIVKGLKADDPSACKSACEADTGGDGSASPIVACFAAGRSGAMCENDPTQTGLGGAIMLMGSCCEGQSDALCKSICSALTANAILKSMISFCN